MTTTTKISKMSIARSIFSEIHTPGYKLPEGKTFRGHFIERAVAEVPMTVHGAATYHQNLSNESRGQSTYKYNKPSKKAVAKAEEVVAETVVQQERWMVVNEAGEEVNSFVSRAKAQAFAKDNGLKWKDRKAA